MVRACFGIQVGALTKQKGGSHIGLRVALSHQSMVRPILPHLGARATPTTPNMLLRHGQGMLRNPSGRLSEQKLDPISNCVWRYRTSQ